MSRKNRKRNRTKVVRGNTQVANTPKTKKNEVEVVSVPEYEVTVSGIKKPRLYISPESLALSHEIVKKASVEIAWYLAIRDLGDNEFVIEGIPLIPPQTVSGTSVDIESNQAGALLEEIDDRGEDPNIYRVHAHSHVEMGVSPSGIDAHHWGQFNETYKGQPCVRLIFNRGKEYYAEIKLPVGEEGVMVSFRVNLEIYHPFLKEMPDEIKKKVKETVQQSGSTSYHGYFHRTGAYQHPYTSQPRPQYAWDLETQHNKELDADIEDEFEIVFEEVQEQENEIWKQLEWIPNCVSDLDFVDKINPEAAADAVSEWIETTFDSLTTSQHLAYLNATIKNVKSRVYLDRYKGVIEVVGEFDQYETANIPAQAWQTVISDAIVSLLLDFEENYGV